MYWNPDGPRIGYIDGDLMVYSGCAKHEGDDTFDALAEYFDSYIEQLADDLLLDEFHLYVTAGGNFRKDVYPEYKANRTSRPKPKWLVDSYKYLYASWGAHAERTYEADDLLGIALTENPNGLLISYDKDLDQIPGWHFNWRKGELYHVEAKDATKFLATQMLTGDRTDNIPGVPGIGPVKAKKLLEGISHPDSLLFRCYEIYQEHGLTLEQFKQYYKCLKILTEKAQVWPELRQLEG